MIRVLLVDDQELVRSGLRLLLEGEADIDVVGEAGNGRDGVALALDLRPDVVLMDVRMPVMDGVAATRALAGSPGEDAPAVLVLTTYDLDEYVFEALRAGARGFLLKHATAEELLTGLRAVAAGDAVVSPQVTRRLVEAFVPAAASAPGPEYARLTERERAVLELVARGRSNAEIAAALYVEPSTVKTHVANVLAKLGLRDRVQAVIWAYEHGLLRPGA